MASNMVMFRQKSSAGVLAIATTNEELLVDRLEAEGQNHLEEGEEIPDYRMVLKVNTRNLKHATDEMVSADDLHTEETKEDYALKGRKSDIADPLYEDIVDFRGLVTSTFGNSVATTLRFKGRTPTDPVGLSRFTSEVLTALKNNPLPAPKRRGITIDQNLWINDLQNMKDKLDKHTRDTATEKRETELAMIKKNKAIAEYDRVFMYVAGTLSSWFKFIGERELAERVRPSRSKPGRTINSDEFEEAPKEENPDTTA